MRGRQVGRSLAAAALCCLPAANVVVQGFVAPRGTPVAAARASSSSSHSGRRGGAVRMAVKIEDVLKDPKWPEEPFYRPGDFSRQDESSDAVFYDSPRLVTHIDDAAVRAVCACV
jgi:hypothetical protein